MLYLYNLNSKFNRKKEYSFELNTCQRSLLITTEELTDISQHYECYIGQKAYTYLLQVICGLQSRLIAENEIVGQFKEALTQYLALNNRNHEIVIALQKALQDQKYIRSNYLLGISQKTYAALSKKLIQNYLDRSSKVLILGSGMLAEDLINQFKKQATLHLSARNLEVSQNLSKKHQVDLIPWKDLEKYQDYDFIFNTIGTQDHILDDSFFEHWASDNNYFIDLGDPEINIDTKYKKNNFYNLEKIYELGAIANEEKASKINKAHEEIMKLSEKRIAWFRESLHKRKAHEASDNRNAGQSPRQISS